MFFLIFLFLLFLIPILYVVFVLLLEILIVILIITCCKYAYKFILEKTNRFILFIKQKTENICDVFLFNYNAIKNDTYSFIALHLNKLKIYLDNILERVAQLKNLFFNWATRPKIIAFAITLSLLQWIHYQLVIAGIEIKYINIINSMKTENLQLENTCLEIIQNLHDRLREYENEEIIRVKNRISEKNNLLTTPELLLFITICWLSLNVIGVTGWELSKLIYQQLTYIDDFVDLPLKADWNPLKDFENWIISYSIPNNWINYYFYDLQGPSSSILDPRINLTRPESAYGIARFRTPGMPVNSTYVFYYRTLR